MDSRAPSANEEPVALPEYRPPPVERAKSTKKAQSFLGLNHKSSRNKLTKQTSRGKNVERDASAVESPTVTTKSSGISWKSRKSVEKEAQKAKGGIGSGVAHNRPTPISIEPRESTSVFRTLRNDIAAHSHVANDFPPTPRSPWLPSPALGKKFGYDAFPEPRWDTPDQLTPAASIKNFEPPKSKPMLHENSSDSALKSKPIKSALKQSKSTMDVGKNSDAVSVSKSAKKVDMSSLFPKPAMSGSRLFSPSRFLNSPTELIDGPEMFPQHTTRAELKRRTGTGRLEVITTSTAENNPTDSRSIETARVKVFDKDIFDPTKRTVHRPPKGIQNWFDGIDISSDDADGDDGFRPTLETQVETESSDMAATTQCTDFAHLSPTSGARRDSDILRPAPNRATTNRFAPFEDQSKHAVQQRSNASTPKVAEPYRYAPTPSVTSETEHNDNGRSLSFSKFEVGSVLSLSDSDEDRRRQNPSRPPKTVDDERIYTASASTVTVQGPSIPPRKVHHRASPGGQRDGLRKGQPSPSPSNRRSRTSLDHTMAGSVPSTARNTTYSDVIGNSRRPSSSISRQKIASRRLTGSSNQTTFEDGRSIAGATSISSAPSAMSDADRLMAVTEEEMMLLELMRQKRAAMRDYLPSERHGGLRDSLTQTKGRPENFHLLESELLRRRGSAATSGRRSSTRENRMSGSISALPPLPHGRRGSKATLADSQDLSYEQLQLLTALRKEEADNARKIERFLRQQSPVDERYPTALPDSRLMRKASASERDSTLSSQFEEAFAQADMKASSSQKLTQRLTEMVPGRDSYSTTFEEHDVEDQRMRMYVDAQKAAIGSKRMQRLHDAEAPYKQGPTPDWDADVETNDELETDAHGDSNVEESEDTMRRTTLRNRHSWTVDDRLKKGSRMSLLDTPVLEEEPVPELKQRQSTQRQKSTRSKQTSVPPFDTRPEAPSVDTSRIAANNDDMRRDGASSVASMRKRLEQLKSPTNQDHDYPSSRHHGRVNAASPAVESRPTPTSTASTKRADSSLTRVYGVPVTSLAKEEAYHSSSSQASLPGSAKRYLPDKRSPTSSTIDNTEAVPRITSMNSITSASEDVLAAWAELGGGTDIYTARRPFIRTSRDAARGH